MAVTWTSASSSASRVAAGKITSSNVWQGTKGFDQIVDTLPSGVNEASDDHARHRDRTAAVLQLFPPFESPICQERLPGDLSCRSLSGRPSLLETSSRRGSFQLCRSMTMPLTSAIATRRTRGSYTSTIASTSSFVRHSSQRHSDSGVQQTLPAQWPKESCRSSCGSVNPWRLIVSLPSLHLHNLAVP